MADFDLFNYPTAPPVMCRRCGGIFEGPITLPDGSIKPGHAQGDPATCRAMGNGQRDKRRRTATR